MEETDLNRKNVEKYFNRRVNDSGLLLIKPKFTYNIGKYQLYLYPADVYENGRLFSQLMITKFDKSDKEISHKMFYVEENVDILLPTGSLEAAVWEIYSWPEHYRFDGKKSESSSSIKKL